MLSQSIDLYKNLQKRYSRRINLDLKRIQKVLTSLAFPHLELRNPINVLGSDGKMSTLTSLKYFLEAHKKNITTFTSPHLYDVRHRFWLKNKYITLKEIKKYTKLVEATNLKLTLFELLTCVYILAAKNQKKISYHLIEAGLLFKKDSTNLWADPKAQIITNINFQHQDWVEPKTLKEICRQKLDSLSQNTTIYVGKQHPKTLKIIKNILKDNKSKQIYATSFKVKKIKDCYFYQDKKNIIPIKSKTIHSEGLINNLSLAIKVALDFGVPKKIIIKTIPKIQFEGRVQYLVVGKFKKLLNLNEKLLIDGCHSIASAMNLHNYLKTLKEPIYGIWGMQKNKLPHQFIKSFDQIFKKIITVTIPNEPNALKATKLKKIGKKYMPTSAAANIQTALKQISSKEKKTIVIFGSLYLVGAVIGKN
jgi:dihydrofolate synthase/folylpolyglutamate synthase|tara:strand:+ start:344 stop:1603 length:1260 start_codon:yes stop_codon:yes gene_type:complete